MRSVWLGGVALVAISAFVPAVAEVPARSTVTLEAVEKAVATLDATAASEIASGAVPGMAIAVVFQDKVLFAKGYGLGDTRAGTPVDVDTVFQLASVS